MTHCSNSEKEKSLMSASHTGLLLLAKEGDGDAFARLAEEYKPMLDSVVASYKSDLCDQDVEELHQEALLAFHRAVQSYELLYGKSLNYSALAFGKEIFDEDLCERALSKLNIATRPYKNTQSVKTDTSYQMRPFKRPTVFPKRLRSETFARRAESPCRFSRTSAIIRALR